MQQGLWVQTVVKGSRDCGCKRSSKAAGIVAVKGSRDCGFHARAKAAYKDPLLGVEVRGVEQLRPQAWRVRAARLLVAVRRVGDTVVVPARNQY